MKFQAYFFTMRLLLSVSFIFSFFQKHVIYDEDLLQSLVFSEALKPLSEVLFFFSYSEKLSIGIY